MAEAASPSAAAAAFSGLTLHDEEEFFDVPDAVTEINVVSRQPDKVLLAWAAPRDNARQIDRYQVLARPWRVGGGIDPLPPQELDGFPDEDRDDEANCRLLEVLVPGVASSAAGGGGKEGGGEEGPCSCWLSRFEPCKVDTDEISAKDSLPTAAWVSVRAHNEEGWGEWSRAALAVFRRAPLCPPGAVLHTWGCAEDGRLGRGPMTSEVAEAGPVTGLAGERLCSLAAGSHCAAVTDRDGLFVWGTWVPREEDGDGPDTVLGIQLAPALLAPAFVPHDVACGRFTTAVLSAEGRLYAWGPNEVGQCGVDGPRVLQGLAPLRVPGGAPVVRMAMGEFHGLALTANGEAVAWGQGQGEPMPLTAGLDLGLEDLDIQPGRIPEHVAWNQPVPRLLEVPARVVEIAASGFHSALVTDDGRLWTWGNNDCGQLGHGDDALQVAGVRPRPVEALVGHAVARVALGGFHSTAVDKAGAIFTWGDNKRGQCGQGEVKRITSPQPLELPGRARCISVSCGGHFTFLQVDASPRFYACGWGKDGCLSFGRPVKRNTKPTAIGASEPWLRLFAGSIHVAGLRLDSS